MKRNLVLGSSGFIGSGFSRYLTSKGEEVVPYDIKRSGLEDLRFTRLNFKNIDAVYFLAWDVGGSKYLYCGDTQMAQLKWNTEMMFNVFPQLEQAKIPFLFISSQLVCMDNAYGATKRLGEVWAREAGGASIRLWNVYGEYEECSRKSHVVADLIFDALEVGAINLLTNGEEIRRFLYATDAYEGMIRAMERQPKDVYDLAGEVPISIYELAKMIARHTHVSKVFEGVATGEMPVVQKCNNLPGWSQEVGLTDGIKRTIKLYRAMKGMSYERQ